MMIASPRKQTQEKQLDRKIKEIGNILNIEFCFPVPMLQATGS